MSKNIHWVLCAAGRGKRFRDHGIETPKPLIRIKSKSMLEMAMSSLPIRPGDHITLLTLASDQIKEALSKQLALRYPGCKLKWHELPRLTRGQLETALVAFEDSMSRLPIAIFNCDTYFKCKGLRQKLLNKRISGWIPCYPAEGSAWSFCEINEDTQQVLAVAEKHRISKWATVGLYSFQSPSHFFLMARKHIRKLPRSEEAFVAPLYNDYIAAKEKVKILPCQSFKPFGTIEQLNEYWDITLKQLKRGRKKK